MNGVRRITRAGGKQLYYVAFSFRRVQCREAVHLAHSTKNDAHCVSLRSEILRKIANGGFRYVDYFPDSPRAVLFGHAAPRTGLLKDALQAYRDRVKNTFAASTYSATRKAIDNVLVPWCGDKRIAELKPSDIRDWVGTKAVSLKRIRNLLLPLRAVLDEAVADELIPFNPLDRLKLAKLVPAAKRVSDFEPDPYTEAEVFTLLERIPLPQRLGFQLWAYTGLRTGELIALRWPRVDLEANTIRIVETTTERQDKDRTKTLAGMRTVPLLPAAREAIDLMRAHTQLGNDRLTVNPKSTRRDKAWDDKRLAAMWKAAHKGTSIAYRNPYQLRHTFASQLLSQGENPAYISRLLGHKTVEMVTRHYGRWVAEGEKLGFDRPPRQYGMRTLWGTPIHSSFTHADGKTA
jgi:integrase